MDIEKIIRDYLSQIVHMSLATSKDNKPWVCEVHLKNALGWLECKIIDLPKDVGGNHLMVIGQFTKAAVNPDYYNEEISPKGNPKPFMQWERNNFVEASDIFSIDYFGEPKV